MADRAVSESRERVRAAIQNSGFEFPMRRLTVNLAPAHVRKAGPGFDLAIACAVLAARTPRHGWTSPVRDSSPYTASCP
jgi:magnesium chelatase family protein